MITLLFITLFVLGVIVLTVLAAGIGGLAIVIQFADIIIAGFIIYWLFNKFFKKKNK